MEAATGQRRRRIRATRHEEGFWTVHHRLTPASRSDVVEIVLGDCPERCKTAVYELTTSAGIYRVSRESFEYILQTERYMAHPYVPGGNTESGITIGYGYDLGHQSAWQVRQDLRGLLDEQELQALLQVVGLQGEQAKAAVAEMTRVELGSDEAMELARRMKARYAQRVVDIYPQAVDLHPHCEGALLSLVINRGASLSSRDSRREMREIQADLASGHPERVPGRLRSMKRLWEGKGLTGLLLRRDREAEFFERGVRCDCWE